MNSGKIYEMVLHRKLVRRLLCIKLILTGFARKRSARGTVVCSLLSCCKIFFVKNSRKFSQQPGSIGKKEDIPKKKRRSGVNQNTKTGKGAVNGKKRTNKTRVNGKKRTNKGTDNGKKSPELGDGEMVDRRKAKFESWNGSVNPISEAEDDDEPQETPVKENTPKLE
jgi:hypothetical protein